MAHLGSGAPRRRKRCQWVLDHLTIGVRTAPGAMVPEAAGPPEGRTGGARFRYSDTRSGSKRAAPSSKMPIEDHLGGWASMASMGIFEAADCPESSAVGAGERSSGARRRPAPARRDAEGDRCRHRPGGSGRAAAQRMAEANRLSRATSHRAARGSCRAASAGTTGSPGGCHATPSSVQNPDTNVSCISAHRYSPGIWFVRGSGSPLRCHVPRNSRRV